MYVLLLVRQGRRPAIIVTTKFEKHAALKDKRQRHQPLIIT
jgi:hypothetical protein